MALKTFSSLPRELRNSVMDVHFFSVRLLSMSVTINVYNSQYVCVVRKKLIQNVKKC